MLSLNANIDAVVEQYLEKNISYTSNYTGIEDITKEVQILSAEMVDSEGKISDYFSHKEDIHIKIKVKNLSIKKGIVCSLGLQDRLERKVFTDQIELEPNSGTTIYQVRLPSGLLMPNKLSISLALHVPNKELIEFIENALNFEIVDQGNEFSIYGNVDNGVIYSNLKWSTQS